MRFLLGSFRLVCLKVAAEHSSVSVRAMAADDQFDLVGLTEEEQSMLTMLVAKASMGKGSSSAELGAMTDAPKRRGDEIESCRRQGASAPMLQSLCHQHRSLGKRW